MNEVQDVITACYRVEMSDTSYYETAYKKEEFLYWQPVPEWIMELKNISSILDIGTAYGTLLLFAALNHNVSTRHAVDPVNYMSSTLRSKYGIESFTIDIERDNTSRFQKYDLIILTEVIEHFNFHPVPTLIKISKLMHANSYLIVTTPDSAEWGHVTEYYSSLDTIPEYAGQRQEWIDGHIWQYSKAEIEDVFLKVGFKIEKFAYSPGVTARHLCYQLKLVDKLALYSDIAKTFDISVEFVRSYFKYNKWENFSQENWQEFHETLDPLQKMYVEFAMSTSIRGKDMVRLVEKHFCIRNKGRYLDVGTAYGGFLRAFKKFGFQEVVGIELQEHLASFGKANINGMISARILNIDFEKTDCSNLGTFDLITCNDVIEHVKNPALTIQKMSSLLANKGCLCLEVPNKDCIEFVKSDGHFQLFGITQLLREDAATYYSEILNLSRNEYLFEMGESYELEWYFKNLAENKLNPRIVDRHLIAEIDDVPRLIAELKEVFKNWHDKDQPKLSVATAQMITLKIEIYLSKLEEDFSALDDEASITRFKDKYLRSFWTIFALK